MEKKANKMIADFKKLHPKVNINKVLKFATEHNFPQLEVAYKVMLAIKK